MTTGGKSNKEYTVKENKFYLKCKQKISKNRQKIKQKKQKWLSSALEKLRQDEDEAKNIFVNMTTTKKENRKKVVL